MADAKKKWGTTTILEWGSKHIVEQLKCINGESNYLPCQLGRDLRNYEICDYISVPSMHAKNSFLMHGIPEAKLFTDPYGVDLTQFHATECTNEYDLIMVGGWRYEKGSDLIVGLCKKYHYRFIHVGALVNMDFPDDPNMSHIDPVDQKELLYYYAKAKVFILPSRAEGLAMVQAQAIACGLPVVCSKETGGVDLRSLIQEKQWIIEMEDLTVESLYTCVEKALALASEQRGERNYVKADLENLTWKAYGLRYNHFIQQTIQKS